MELLHYEHNLLKKFMKKWCFHLFQHLSNRSLMNNVILFHQMKTSKYASNRNYKVDILLSFRKWYEYTKRKIKYNKCCKLIKILNKLWKFQYNQHIKEAFNKWKRRIRWPLVLNFFRLNKLKYGLNQWIAYIYGTKKPLNFSIPINININMNNMKLSRYAQMNTLKVAKYFHSSKLF